MGIDWQVFVNIYSDNESDLQKIVENFSKYFKENILIEENEGRVYKTKKCISIEYSVHTVGLSTERLELYLYELSRIVSDYPSCFLKAGWWADSGTMKSYICWNEDCYVKDKFLSYETIDDQFYPHYQRDGRPMMLFRKNSIQKEEQKYKVNLCFESHTPIHRERIESVLKWFDVSYCKGCSNWIRVHFISKNLHFLRFYSLLQEYKDSYITIDWHLVDGTQSGEWIGHNNENNLTVQSIHYPTNPNLYNGTWNSGEKVCINEQITKSYENK